MTHRKNSVPSKNEMVFFEDLATDDTADSSTATEDVVDQLNDTSTNDNADSANSTGSDSDTNTADDDEGKKPVPYSRFKEVLEDGKATKAQVAELTSKLEELTKVDKQVDKADADSDSSTDDDGLTKEGRAILKKHGFLTKDDLEAAIKAEREAINMESQIKTDVADLGGWAKKQGYPEFDAPKVLKWAEENFGSVRSKAGLKSAYLAMNDEAIQEANTKRILAEAGKPKATAERPGTGGKPEPTQAKKGGDLKSRALEALERFDRANSGS